MFVIFFSQYDSLTPYYLKVMPFQNIRNAINLFKELNAFVNHTRFANAFYAPQYGSIAILEAVTQFYYDLVDQARTGIYYSVFFLFFSPPVSDLFGQYILLTCTKHFVLFFHSQTHAYTNTHIHSSR